VSTQKCCAYLLKLQAHAKIRVFSCYNRQIGKFGARNQEFSTVNQQNHQTTATILQFPVQGRESLLRRRPAQTAGVAHFMSKTMPLLSSGAWYHDAAIRDEEPGRKR
jgi:hypothetical protein